MPEIIEKFFEPSDRLASPKTGITSVNYKLHKYSKAKSTPLLFNNILRCKVVYGNVLSLPISVRKFVEESVALCTPDQIHICDGSDAENEMIVKELMDDGTIVALPKYENCYLARTNIADVARVESRTFICTDEKKEAVCTSKNEQNSSLVNWISMNDYEKEVMKRFPGSMTGRCMYIIPFSMGPVGSPLSKIGIEITDSKYVVASMRIMTRMGSAVLDEINNGSDFVKCLHSVGKPENGKISVPSWPCDPERVIILHKPKENEIISYGSSYGGNSLLGKKCFALRIGSTIGRREGWLAEHMLILGITCPNGTKKYVAAAFPSACGKTNLAMMTPSLPGYKVECIGDDIAWMKFDSNGQLRAINPENGFFGVAPGTGKNTNPIAMKTIFKNTIFTNVASTSDGGVYWEGMEEDIAKDVKITDWLGDPWEFGSKSPAAHPNSRFCSPAINCPIIDPDWENPEGVPISAIIFGGRRPSGVPLIYEATNWKHGVFIGSSMRSETTAAAEHKKKMIMHDPFAMRPFFGYNFGKYLSHWLEMEERCKSLNGTMPKIFHVNWFRKGKKGEFLWPGFGENSRVLDWVLKRIDSIDCHNETPIGYVPSNGALRLENINTDIDLEELFSIPKDFWLKELEDIQIFFDSQVGTDLPTDIQSELDRIKTAMENWS